jgi:hypothetical protein
VPSACDNPANDIVGFIHKQMSQVRRNLSQPVKRNGWDITGGAQGDLRTVRLADDGEVTDVVTASGRGPTPSSACESVVSRSPQFN